MACNCCATFRPRYKKLVDYIFPAYPEDGLVKSNMEKLIWFAMHAPHKLDRIGEYLAHRLYRDIYRKRTGYVIIAMDATDQLLIACHANSLNLFVESFLQMIQKLLESQEPMLQLRASKSFEKYANIREEVPQYHRRYDFFVAKFASMAYFNDSDAHMQWQMRSAGVIGIQGVVRKTDYDDLGDNIWQPTHMNKIIPALLFNMEDKMSFQSSEETDHDCKKMPHEMAEICLREIVSRATSAKIVNVVKPVLDHMDQNGVWVVNDFAVLTFKLVMFSIQAQNSITVIKLLIGHLNDKSESCAEWKIGIADVLSKVIPIAAGECIGPSVIDIINSLLEQIKSSILSEKERVHEVESSYEKVYQETLIHALGEYANHLPDYQKIESMVYIINKVPCIDQIDGDSSPRPAWELKLQHLLLKSLLKVSTKYKTLNYATTFSHTFLIRLIRMSLSRDSDIRLTVQQILHTLFDRHENAQKLESATIDVGLLKLNSGKIMRQDINFWKKFGNDILFSIQENCQINNNRLENVEALYTTLMLIITEIRHDDVLVDVIKILFNIQSSAIAESNARSKLSSTLRMQLMGLVAAVMVAISHCVVGLKDHVKSVIDQRSQQATQLLPPLSAHYGSHSITFDQLDPVLLFDLDVVLNVLKESDLDARRLTSNIYTSSSLRRASTVAHRMSETGSLADISTLNVEVDSIGSTPELPKKMLTEVTFESLKEVLTDSTDGQGRRRIALKAAQNSPDDGALSDSVKDFMTLPYHVLLERAESSDKFHDKLTDILAGLTVSRQSHGYPAPSGVHISGVFTPYQNQLNLVSPDAMYQLPYPEIIY